MTSIVPMKCPINFVDPDLPLFPYGHCGVSTLCDRPGHRSRLIDNYMVVFMPSHLHCPHNFTSSSVKYLDQKVICKKIFDLPNAIDLVHECTPVCGLTQNAYIYMFTRHVSCALLSLFGPGKTRKNFN